MDDLSLKERFPGIEIESVTIRPDDATDLTYRVLTLLKELTANAFNAAATRRTVEAQGIDWTEALNSFFPESGEITSLYLQDCFLFGSGRCTDEIAQRTLGAIQAAKGHKSCDVRQTNDASKHSILDFSEILLTEQMIWDVIAHILVKANGPFEMGENIVAFNTFDGYEAGRDYFAKPPYTTEEKELVEGIEELIDCFTFGNKQLTREAYEKYLADCQRFQVLILNYVIRELELCEFLKPLGQVEISKDSGEAVRLYLVEMQPTLEEESQSRLVLPHKYVLQWTNDDDKALLMVECIDYQLEDDCSDMYINCMVFMRDNEGAYELDDERFAVAEKMYIVLGFKELLELFVMNSDASMKKTCDYFLTTLNAKHKNRTGYDGKWMGIYEACNRKAVQEC